MKRAVYVLSVAVLLFTSSAWAHDRIALVVPDEPTEPSIRAEERLRAELSAAGYVVVTVPVEGDVDRARLRSIAKRTTSTAAVSVQNAGSTLVGAVWVKDETTGQESLDPVRPARASLEGAAMFAIWAAEQLRASVLANEAEAKPVQTAPPKPKPVATSEPPAPSEPKPAPPKPIESARQTSYALSGGLSVLFGPGGLPAGVGPSLSLSWTANRWFGALRFIGPVASSIETSSGTVDVDQEQALVRVGIAGLWSRRQVVVPFASAGLGAYRLAARGDALPPYQSASNQAWSGVFHLTGGLRLRITESFFVDGEGGVWVASSRPVVRAHDAPDASIGKPGFIGSLELGLAW